MPMKETCESKAREPYAIICILKAANSNFLRPEENFPPKATEKT